MHQSTQQSVLIPSQTNFESLGSIKKDQQSIFLNKDNIEQWPNEFIQFVKDIIEQGKFNSRQDKSKQTYKQSNQDSLDSLIYSHTIIGFTHSIHSLINEYHGLLTKLSTDYPEHVPHKSLLGHICGLLMFNEIEIYTWCFIVFALVVPDNYLFQQQCGIQFPTISELVLVSALYVKRYLNEQNSQKQTKTSESSDDQDQLLIFQVLLETQYFKENFDQSRLNCILESIDKIKSAINTNNIYMITQQMRRHEDLNNKVSCMEEQDLNRMVHDLVRGQKKNDQNNQNANLQYGSNEAQLVRTRQYNKEQVFNPK